MEQNKKQNRAERRHGATVKTETAAQRAQRLIAAYTTVRK